MIMKTIFYAKSKENKVVEFGTFESMKKRTEALLEACEVQTYTKTVVVLTSGHKMTDQTLYGTVI